jgi:hypothetical protein
LVLRRAAAGVSWLLEQDDRCEITSIREPGVVVPGLFLVEAARRLVVTPGPCRHLLVNRSTRNSNTIVARISIRIASFLRACGPGRELVLPAVLEVRFEVPAATW